MSPSVSPAPAVLTSPCEGYAAGTTGRVAGEHQGCLVFAPDEPAAVARWARPRSSLVVPAPLIAPRS
jgi:hypothetical protein